MTTKLYWQALKQLPDNFVDDETRAVQFMEKVIVAVNPNHAPICFYASVGKWEELTFDENNKAIVPPEENTQNVIIAINQGGKRLGSVTLVTEVSKALLLGEIVRFEIGGYKKTISAFTHVHARSERCSD